MDWAWDKLTQVGDDIIQVFDVAYKLVHESSNTTNNAAKENILNSEDIEIGEDVLDDETSPLEGIASGVIKDILSKQAQNGPQTFTEQIQAFKSAVTWSEPFVLSLVVFNVIITLLCFLASRKKYGRVFLMCIITAIIVSAQYINSYAAIHWESFATQNYFDQNGIFLSIMLCAPLLINSLGLLISLVLEAASLLVKVKVKELEAKKGKGKKADKNKDKKNNSKKKESKKTK